MLNGGGTASARILAEGSLVRRILIVFFAALSAQFLFLQPVSAQAARPVAGSAGPAYRINAGDELEVMVWGDDRLQRVVRVLPDGTFSFPLVGQVVAAGQLPSDLERIISAALRRCRSERLRKRALASSENGQCISFSTSARR